MKVRDVLTVIGTACATTAVLLAWFAPRGVTAEGESAAIRPHVAVPTLAVDDCRIRLETDRGDYAAGDQPVLKLKATNDGDTTASLRVQLAITGTSPTSPFSRLVALPSPLWNGEWAVEVPPGETREVVVPTETPLPAEQEISITMGTGDRSILALAPISHRGTPQAGPAVSEDEVAQNVARPDLTQRLRMLGHRTAQTEAADRP